MTRQSPDQEQVFILARQAGFTSAANTGNLEGVLAFFTPDVSYSDFGQGAQGTNLHFDGVVQFFTTQFAAPKLPQIITNNVTGSRYFTAWEFDLTLTTATDVFPLRTVLLQWWQKRNDAEGDDNDPKNWQIFQVRTYSTPIAGLNV